MALRKLLAAGLASLVLATNACYSGNFIANAEIPFAENFARRYVLDRASENQIVMFGEVHYDMDPYELSGIMLEYHYPYRADNDFVISLLPELKNRGFDYLAIEMPRDICGVSFADVIHDYVSGSITREEISPEDLDVLDLEAAGWLDMIETAKLFGIDVVPYDIVPDETFSSMPVSHLREAESFKNMKEIIFDIEPKAKVAVYCGASHVNDGSYVWEENGVIYGNGTKWLGQYLDEYTGGRNFTVSFSENVGVVMPHADFKVVFD